MQSVSKFNLNGGLKRIVSTLVCVMMVLATFPMHMLKNTVSAAGGGIDRPNLEFGKWQRSFELDGDRGSFS